MTVALNRRHFLAGAATVSATLTPAAPAFALAPAEQQLTGLMDRLWDEQLRRFPETATACGADTGRHAPLRARLDPWSREAREDWVDWARSAARRIAAIDATALPEQTLVHRAVLLDHFGKIADLGTRYRFGASASDAWAPVAPYALSPATGPHRAIPELLDARHPVACKADCEAWLERLAAFPHALDAATESFRSDAAAGVVPAADLIGATLAQLGALRQRDGAADQLATGLAQRAGTAGVGGDWQARAAGLLDRAVQPALDRQIAALERARGQAGDAAGVWALGEGESFYRDALAWHTATTRTPEEIHALGREQVARLTAELEAVLGGLGLTQGALADRMTALARLPRERFADDQAGRAALLTGFAATLDRVRPMLPELFGVLPAVPGTVSPMPAGFAVTMGSVYVEGAAAGTTLYVDVVRTAGWSRHAIATTALREGIPARLWEAASGPRSGELPAIRRRGTRYGAHAEGWALYAEHVLDDEGFYAGDPASRAGYLHDHLLRMARAVADTGLHARRWSRDAALAYLIETAGRPRAEMQREVERLCTAPGQACAGLVGQAEWQRLRALARRMAGASFEPRQFHRLVQLGRAPFAVLDEVVATTFTKRLSVLATRRV
ncbi:DUF885 domain-containing protein [Novosphingobium piscinae]|uniref:DUF885 domain-containing protein n=1 Tax=Novosphingobium piscinae TaxID=1507448 RepID=A0A7X1G1J3_9SPHN|nr:DUF885 family protein [Novosphingobium piscinae]MBC2670779.1 DUF885 domain-containing protein [Novosphingobium piscinae]